MPRTSPYSIALAEASGQNSKPARVDIRHRIRKLCGPGSCSTRPKAWATTRSLHAWTHAAASGLQMAQTLLRPASGRTDRSASGRTAPEFSPLTWWLPSRRWPANSQRRPTSPSRWLAGSAPIWPARRRARHRRLDLGHHDLALAERRCDQALAAPLLDLSPRPRLRARGSPGARPLRPPLPRHAAAAR